MGLTRRYDPKTAEPRLQRFWEDAGIYAFEPGASAPVYSIDTPPATVSGALHMGHTFSYSHPDFLARFRRMNGCNVFYPMGFDDNGLPTGRFVERKIGMTADEIGHQQFVQQCREISAQAEEAYQAVWRRLGLSIDWRYTYRTIDERSLRISQLSFLDLYDKGLVYRDKAPAIWCPECRTAIAQAELDDLDRETVFYTLAFRTGEAETLQIATTRPELLPACVAIFVHPKDARFQHLVGRRAIVPISEQSVPILADPGADPQKGTGAVMCCTFGDITDVAWWYAHDLPLVEAIAPDGRMTEAAGDLAGLPVSEAREQVTEILASQDLVLDRETVSQSVRVHERCDTLAEYIVTQQWFIRVLDFKDEFLKAGKEISWHPSHMGTRYRQWVENLRWDWCISRQRPYGVPFPVWYCPSCNEVILATPGELPVDPRSGPSRKACACGNESLNPEVDVMDTWATSSLTPQIVGHWPQGETGRAHLGLYERVFPMSLRPQAHDIIRTWAFYTIVKSMHHFGVLPWQEVAISGWGIAGPGMGKISKSRGGGPMAPLDVIEQYSADAVRYWAASTGLGKDSVISEEKIQIGDRLVRKLWNVARFSSRFLEDYEIPAKSEAGGQLPASLSPADRWILARTQHLVRRATHHLSRNEYAAAKSETESFFWGELADNYVEMAKTRLYGKPGSAREAACFALYHALLAVTKLFAPFLPHVTEEIYQGLFRGMDGTESVHNTRWPIPDPRLESPADEKAGETLVAIATAVRRYKSEHGISLGSELARLHLTAADNALFRMLHEAESDLRSVSRAAAITVGSAPCHGLEAVEAEGPVGVAVAL
jgi:valyl-tRNA synthetase